MNPLSFALKRPITVLAAIGAILVGSGLALTRMKIDIFPNLNLPVIYVVQPYGGMSPEQMEGLLTFPFENHFLYISGIHHVESRNIQGFSQMKLFFHPDTNMMQAMAETVAQVNRARAFMPPGTVPPFVVRYDAGSAPVGYLVLESKTRNIGEIQDAAYIRVRPMVVSLPGVSAPPPFGGNQRTIVIHLDPGRLRSYHLSPDEVIAALNAGNTITPAGNARIKDQMPIVPSNAMVRDPQELGNIPIRPGTTLHLRDIGFVEDSTDIPTSFALVNGRRAVYMLITKRADASTLSVVNAVKETLPAMQAALPEDISLRWEFDQSPYVTRAMLGVASEGLLGAVLTGLMVLVFLRDWRTALVVVLNIPFALLGAVVALWATGQTINIMTLGGLALAVGILVDEATVAVENIHVQMTRTESVALAVWRGTLETAVPRLLAMLCILAVFIPSFFMQGAAGALFVPLALAVGFAMVASYLLSSTLVPVLSVWLLRRHGHHSARSPHEGVVSITRPRRFSLARLQGAYAGLLQFLLRWRRLGLCTYALVAVLVIGLVGPRLGQEIFPSVDSGQFQLRVRAPAGTRIEQTEEIAQQALEVIKSVAGPDNVAISVGFGGVSPSSYTINTVYVWTGGPEEVLLRVALKHGSGQRIDDLKHRLREALPERLGAWLRQRLRTLGVAEDRIAERVADLRFSFEPADIVNEVMSFGSPTPVAVSIDGPDIAASRRHAEKVRDQLARIESLRDLQYVQSLNYPTVEVAVDRQRAGKSKVTTDEVARAMVAYTSSSRFVMPNYWVDPTSGTGYQVQVEVPPVRMDSVKEVELVTVKQTRGGHISLRDVARVREGVAPGEVDRYNMRRTVTLTANLEGEDLGRVSRRVEAALKAAGEPPRGVRVSERGQIVPMRQMFAGLAQGLGLTVVAILILLLAYFQSLRLAIVVVSTVPAVLAGVVLMLFATRTTLNIQSCMGAIMSIGVAVANAILLVTFAERSRHTGAPAVEAALAGARGRLRPILMTSLAMISGMVPMALALGEGGEQTAPLGRAVIGGLLAATPATLFVLPAVFAAMNWMRISSRSVSLHPHDPESRHFVSPVSTNIITPGQEAVFAGQHEPSESASGGTTCNPTV
jgi:multidrug efflux pump subunit AcrB